MRNSARTLLAALALAVGGCAGKPTTATAPVTVAAATKPSKVEPVAVASAAGTPESQDEFGARLKKRGYRQRSVNGELKWCRNQTLTGTHFSNMVCLTEDEIKRSDQHAKDGMDTLGRAGRAVCPNNKCD